MITADDFDTIQLKVRASGYVEEIDWAEGCKPPADAEDFASEAIFVICNSGMKHTVARKIFDKVMPMLRSGGSAHNVFGHHGKADAMDIIWIRRAEFYDGFMDAKDRVEYCGTLPWIGGITKYHLAKNFGEQVAKPDVHLQRLADAEGCTPQALCERLAAETGYKVATVDLILWRACAIGIINSKALA